MKPLHLALKHSCPKIITAYQVVKVRLKCDKIDSNDKFLTAETVERGLGKLLGPVYMEEGDPR